MPHTRWTLKVGAPGVRALARPDGFLWLGASTGLYRSMASGSTAFCPDRMTPPVASGDALLTARNGDIWVGYDFGGSPSIAAAICATPIPGRAGRRQCDRAGARRIDLGRGRIARQNAAVPFSERRWTRYARRRLVDA
ncbi:hypothetical protein ACFOKF_18895 [Sphingobium rhizovicinum]|uniref:Uncharacterized protein n=1 Tax=Sphingobium rhizovicinum TaxID=432308 RepID=A0ABV7NJS2_9SPHN